MRLGFRPEDADHIELVRFGQKERENGARNKSASTQEKPRRRKNVLANILPLEWMTRIHDGKEEAG